jgi:fluoride ion exporter CrcB/FEX
MIGVSGALVTISTFAHEAEPPRVSQAHQNTQLPWLLTGNTGGSQMMTFIYLESYLSHLHSKEV